MSSLFLEQFTFNLPFFPCTSYFFQFDMGIGNLLQNFCTNFLSSVCSSGVVDWGLICYLIILVVKKGSTAQHPARSCQEIRDFGDPIADVEYWIDTKNKRNPFRVYCIMKTDGSEPSANDLPTKGVQCVCCVHVVTMEIKNFEVIKVPCKT